MTLIAADKPYVTVGVAKSLSGMSKRVIRSMLENGLIDGYRTPGGHWRISVDSFNDYMHRDDNVALEIVRSLRL